MKIEGVRILNKQIHHDSRGYFSNLWHQQDVNLTSLKQINLSMNTKAGTIRGLHYQVYPHEDCKVVICLRGAIFDVLTDLRPGSHTFGRTMSIELTEDSTEIVFVPKLVAHGFQTLVDETYVMYLHSGIYNKTSERGIHPLDKTLAIPWKLPPSVISDRDLNLQSFQEFVADL